jgi:hypothetical protein
MNRVCSRIMADAGGTIYVGRAGCGLRPSEPPVPTDQREVLQIA